MELPKERFVSEPLRPVPKAPGLPGTRTGEPLLPGKFTWRGTEYRVAEVLEKWKETGPCRHGSGEKYVRKHWFRIKTEGGEELTIYFERQPRSKKDSKKRWWVYSVVGKSEKSKFSR